MRSYASEMRFTGLPDTRGMALAPIDAPARSSQYANQWINQITYLTTAGVTAFQAVATKLHSSWLRPPFYLSAALNYYLAGRLAGSWGGER